MAQAQPLTRGVPATDVLASDPLDNSPLLFRYDVSTPDAIALAGERRWHLDGPGAGPDSRVVFGFSPLQANRAQLDELWELMRHLDKDARTLIVLKEVDGLSYDEIATTLDLPLSTVKTRLFRARKALKDALKDWN